MRTNQFLHKRLEVRLCHHIFETILSRLVILEGNSDKSGKRGCRVVELLQDEGSAVVSRVFQHPQDDSIVVFSRVFQRLQDDSTVAVSRVFQHLPTADLIPGISIDVEGNKVAQM